MDPAKLDARIGVDHRDLAACLQGDEQVIAGTVERRRAGYAGIVEVKARAVSFGERRQVDLGTDAAHGILEVEVVAVAQGAALDVVLLGRHPGALAVGRDRRHRQVVGDARALVGVVLLVAVLQQDGAVDGHRPRRIDDHDFTAAAGSLYGGRAFARHRRGDVAAHQEPAAIGGDGEVARVGADGQAGGRGAGAWVELEHGAGGFQHHVGGAAVGRKRQAERLRRGRQADGLLHFQGGGVDHRQGRRRLVADPDPAVRGDRKRPGRLADGNFGQFGVGGRIERSDAVIVLVDHPQPVVGHGHVRRQGRTVGGVRQMHRLDEGGRAGDVVAVLGGHPHHEQARGGVSVAGRRRGGIGGFRRIVAERPLELGVAAVVDAGREADGRVDQPGRSGDRAERERGRADGPDKVHFRGRAVAVLHPDDGVIGAGGTGLPADQAGAGGDSEPRRQANRTVGQAIAIGVAGGHRQGHQLAPGCGFGWRSQ